MPVPSPAPRSPLPVCAQSRARNDPGVLRPRRLRAGGAPDRTAPSHRGVRTPKTLSALPAARRPRPARTRTAPRPAAAPDDRPLAPAH
eukprot:3521680-Prymnesium_polylepis.1